MSESKAEEKEYKYCLRWSGTYDTPKLRAAMERCKDVKLFRAAEPYFVNAEEFNTLVEKGVISKAQSWSQVKGDEIGLITKAKFGSPSQWEMISNCKYDFLEGWEAHERFLSPKKEGLI